jgi:hypothetical protein
MEWHVPTAMAIRKRAASHDPSLVPWLGVFFDDALAADTKIDAILFNKKRR